MIRIKIAKWVKDLKPDSIKVGSIVNIVASKHKEHLAIVVEKKDNRYLVVKI